MRRCHFGLKSGAWSWETKVESHGTGCGSLLSPKRTQLQAVVEVQRPDSPPEGRLEFTET
jgi:hypothetical protein